MKERNQKIKRPGSLQFQTYNRIKYLITSGQLQFGEIYSANQFAEILGVSRTSVRESLLQLAGDGLLMSITGRGFKIRHYSEKEIKDFCKTRKIIETYVVERVLGEMKRQDIQSMEDILKQAINIDEKDIYGFIEADRVFHMNLIRRYNNRHIESIMEKIGNIISILGRKILSNSERIQEVNKEHRSILDALLQKNAKYAVKAMICHLDMTEKKLIQNL